MKSQDYEPRYLGIGGQKLFRKYSNVIILLITLAIALPGTIVFPVQNAIAQSPSLNKSKNIILISSNILLILIINIPI